MFAWDQVLLPDSGQPPVDYVYKQTFILSSLVQDTGYEAMVQVGIKIEHYSLLDLSLAYW